MIEKLLSFASMAILVWLILGGYLYHKQISVLTLNLSVILFGFAMGMTLFVVYPPEANEGLLNYEFTSFESLVISIPGYLAFIFFLSWLTRKIQIARYIILFLLMTSISTLMGLVFPGNKLQDDLAINLLADGITIFLAYIFIEVYKDDESKKQASTLLSKVESLQISTSDATTTQLGDPIPYSIDEPEPNVVLTRLSTVDKNNLWFVAAILFSLGVILGRVWRSTQRSE